MSARPFQVGDRVRITKRRMVLDDLVTVGTVDEFQRILPDVPITMWARLDEPDEGIALTSAWVTDDHTAPARPKWESIELLEPATLDLQAIGAATIAEYAPDEDFAAESVAVVEAPRPSFVLDQRVQVVEPEHPLFGREGRVYKSQPDSLGRIRVDIDRAPDGMHDGWHAIEAWCLAAVEPEPITDLRPRFSHAGHASAFGGAA